MQKLKTIVLLFFTTLFLSNLSAQDTGIQGMYFSKKTYLPRPLQTFINKKDLLPAPVFDEKPLWVEMYWKTWEIAFKNFQEPSPGSGFVSQFLDPAFNANIFIWDGAFITMFLNVAHPLIPGISSLDNFYAKQHLTGEICREINRTSGIDLEFWKNAENLPLFSRWGFDEYFNKYRSDVIYKGRETPSSNPRLTLDALNHPIIPMVLQL